MNYVEIIERQEELQKEMQELQEERVKIAQSHMSFKHQIKINDKLDIYLDLDYDKKDERILSIATDTDAIHLSVEDYNHISAFLQKYNDAIFSYMSEITKEDEDDKEED